MTVRQMTRQQALLVIATTLIQYRHADDDPIQSWMVRECLRESEHLFSVWVTEEEHTQVLNMLMRHFVDKDVDKISESS